MDSLGPGPETGNGEDPLRAEVTRLLELGDLHAVRALLASGLKDVVLEPETQIIQDGKLDTGVTADLSRNVFTRYNARLCRHYYYITPDARFEGMDCESEGKMSPEEIREFVVGILWTVDAYLEEKSNFLDAVMRGEEKYYNADLITPESIDRIDQVRASFVLARTLLIALASKDDEKLGLGYVDSMTILKLTEILGAACQVIRNTVPSNHFLADALQGIFRSVRDLMPPKDANVTPLVPISVAPTAQGETK